MGYTDKKPYRCSMVVVTRIIFLQFYNRKVEKKKQNFPLNDGREFNDN